ncbi:MAG: ATP-dependent zinc metalloprotease FtsH [bacterium]
MNNSLKSLFFWLIVVILALLTFQFIYNNEGGSANKKEQRKEDITFSEFLKKVENGDVRSVAISEKEVFVELFDGSRTKTRLVFEDPQLVKDLVTKHDIQVESRPLSQQNLWLNIFFQALPMILMLGLIIYFIRQMQIGGNRALSFGKSRARLYTQNGKQPKITFADVAGVDEAKQELQEIVDFLKDPEKFRRLGGKIPKGVLLVGPPGTGKTLIAKAVAGEAEVPFFSISGSDFVEMFVGVGASRVRDLFDQGRKNAPCLIFMDEIDAVGRMRGAGLGGGHDEREQTLNQLLVEMDGFTGNEGVILIAATNRPDILDSALLRPGRFDRQVVIDRPDLRGREEILRVHMREKKVSDNVDPSILAKRTVGFSGADLANVVNEAALLAARRDKNKIEMDEFVEAIERVAIGLERRSRVMSEKERRVTAYHEAGHALVAKLVPKADPVHKVSIIPRGIGALGYTAYAPEEDKYLQSKSELLDKMTYALGGRVAEQIVFGEVTGGAANDIRQVTDIARHMVCELGMSDKLGPLAYGHRDRQVFLGRDLVENKDYSEKTAISIDEEIRRIVGECYDRAKSLVESNKDKLVRIAEALLEREILDGDEIDKLMRGEPLEPLDKKKRHHYYERKAPEPPKRREARTKAELIPETNIEGGSVPTPDG